MPELRGVASSEITVSFLRRLFRPTFLYAFTQNVRFQSGRKPPRIRKGAGTSGRARCLAGTSWPRSSGSIASPVSILGARVEHVFSYMDQNCKLVGASCRNRAAWQAVKYVSFLRRLFRPTFLHNSEIRKPQSSIGQMTSFSLVVWYALPIWSAFSSVKGFRTY